MLLFFLLQKNEVIHEKVNSTMRRAMERMEYHRYTAIPLVDEKGRYVGTLTEGDIFVETKKK